MVPDHTLLSYLDCPRRFEYRFVKHLDAREPSPELYAGRCGHAALDIWYLNNRADDVAIEALSQSWGDYIPPSEHPKAYLTVEHMKHVLTGYFEYWRERDPLQPIRVKLDGGNVITSETPIIADIGNGLIYGGRPDMPHQYGDNGDWLYIADHKFKTGYLSDDLSYYDYHDQLRGYALLLQSKLGVEIGGAVLNFVYMGDSKSPHREPSQKGIIRYLRYGPLHFSPSQLDETHRNIAGKLKMIEHLAAQGYYPQHVSRACNWCAYQPLCKLAPTVRDAKEAEWYVKRPWDFANVEAR